MREHPIPQDIVGYRFHIIGSMTLKQFAELAGGVILALVIYSTNLVDIVKWSLIFISVGIGAATSFLPIAERPLDHWITTFFKVVYRPTKFYWRRATKIPEAFLFQPGANAINPEDELDLTPARRQRIKEYLASVQLSHAQVDRYDQELELKIQKIMNVFETVTPKQIKSTKEPQKPGLKVRIRSLYSKPEEAVAYDQQIEESLTLGGATGLDVALGIDIPITATTTVETEEEDELEQQISAQKGVYAISSDVDKTETEGESACFNAELPFPSRPTQPNKLVGMVLTPNNELIPDVIVQIEDEQGRVVRAIRTNALGQFFITTPLRSGSYSIRLDHDQYEFTNQDIELNNEIVEPIEIRSLG